MMQPSCHLSTLSRTQSAHHQTEHDDVDPVTLDAERLVPSSTTLERDDVAADRRAEQEQQQQPPPPPSPSSPAFTPPATPGTITPLVGPEHIRRGRHPPPPKRSRRASPWTAPSPPAAVAPSARACLRPFRKLSA